MYPTSLQHLAKSFLYILQATKRRVSFEWTLIAGENAGNLEDHLLARKKTSGESWKTHPGILLGGSFVLSQGHTREGSRAWKTDLFELPRRGRFGAISFILAGPTISPPPLHFQPQPGPTPFQFPHVFKKIAFLSFAPATFALYFPPITFWIVCLLLILPYVLHHISTRTPQLFPSTFTALRKLWVQS